MANEWPLRELQYPLPRGDNVKDVYVMKQKIVAFSDPYFSMFSLSS